MKSLYAVITGIGFTLTIVAASYLYLDFRNREGAWVDLQFRTSEPTPEEREQILDTWRDDEIVTTSLMFGAPGAGLLMTGGLLLIFNRTPKHKATP